MSCVTRRDRCSESDTSPESLISILRLSVRYNLWRFLNDNGNREVRRDAVRRFWNTTKYIRLSSIDFVYLALSNRRKAGLSASTSCSPPLLSYLRQNCLHDFSFPPLVFFFVKKKSLWQLNQINQYFKGRRLSLPFPTHTRLSPTRFSHFNGFPVAHSLRKFVA